MSADSFSKTYAINDYGIIGDMHTAALINPGGGIDWCCFPYFDSPSVFARLLDGTGGGHFLIAPEHYQESLNTYLNQTNILITRFLSPKSYISVYSFMPVLTEDGSKIDPEQVMICRIVECKRGVKVPLNIVFDPRPDYARQETELQFSPQEVETKSFPLRLQCNRTILWNPSKRSGQLSISHGDRIVFLLSYGAQQALRDVESRVRSSFFQTRAYWEGWTQKCLYRGHWELAVERSALALKLLTFKPTGAILAAATTSLPEAIGGPRNWDYRFSWIRDSAMTLNALYVLGYHEEAEAFFSWLINKCRQDGNQVQILYPIRDGGSTEEKTLDHLEGYTGSRPVRIGNQAAEQLQLDVFGELLDSIFLYGIFAGDIGDEMWDYVQQLAEEICMHWNTPDEGIWEVRGGRFHFTYSKFMCWLGLDRALRMAEERGVQSPKHWILEKERIRSFLFEHCLHPRENYFVQSAERHIPDAGNLLIPLLRFVDPQEETALNTVAAVLNQLTEQGHVFRYKGDDGLSGHEGAFNICTFWLVEALTAQHEFDSALDLFLNMLEQAGSCGLFSEEIDPISKRALGNYPQAFTHIGLINAALSLNKFVQSSQS